MPLFKVGAEPGSCRVSAHCGGVTRGGGVTRFGGVAGWRMVAV